MAKNGVSGGSKQNPHPGLRFVQFGSAAVKGKIGCQCACACGQPGTDHLLKYTVNWETSGIYNFSNI